MLRCVVATANPDKAAEIVAILSDLGDVELRARPASVPDVEETGVTLEENARLKAVTLAAATGWMSIADDTGLLVDALDGRPGVRSARYAGEDASYEDNVDKLLDELAGCTNRRARFRTVVVASMPDGGEIVVTGEVEGTIAETPVGSGGFGYDSVFVPTEGDGRSFAEMSATEKHAISHRGRALRSLGTALVDAGLLQP
jgi:XTP/dITP diphosphohydrolase